MAPKRLLPPKPTSKYFGPTEGMFEMLKKKTQTVRDATKTEVIDINLQQTTIPLLVGDELPKLQDRLQTLKTAVSSIVEIYTMRRKTAFEWVEHIKREVYKVVDHLVTNDVQTTPLSVEKKNDFLRYSNKMGYAIECLLDDLTELKWAFNDIRDLSELFSFNKHCYDHFGIGNRSENDFFFHIYRGAIEEMESAVEYFEGLRNNIKSPVGSLIEQLNNMVEETIGFESGIFERITIQNEDPVEPASFAQ